MRRARGSRDKESRVAVENDWNAAGVSDCYFLRSQSKVQRITSVFRPTMEPPFLKVFSNVSLTFSLLTC